MLKIVQLQNKVDQLADLSKKESSKVEGVGREDGTCFSGRLTV